MRWSFKLLRLAGIDVRIHVTFLLLLAWVGWAAWAQEGTAEAAIAGIGFVATIFAIVVLHELGHALAARHYGIHTEDITLLPIGGVSRLERMPDDPKAELVIALVGPAVNVVLALLLIVLGLALEQSPWPGDVTDPRLPLIARLMWVNVILAVFNLLPAFPMDGGRALRALLSMRMSRVRATRVAAWLGQAFALLLGFVGLFGNPLLVFIAIFVWLGAAGETQMAELRAAIQGLRVADAMVRDFEVLGPTDTLATASSHVLRGFQTSFPVVSDGGGVVGVLTQPGLIRGLTERGAGAQVGEVMDTEVVTASPSDPLDEAFTQLERTPSHAIPVAVDGLPVGMLTLEGIGEIIAIRTAMDDRRRQGVPRMAA